MSLIEAYLITFITSFCILVVEIIAGRMLAPYVGVSLYTWTSIIGVVLSGISIGAFFGGRLADRIPEKKTVGRLLLISGIAVLLISPFINLVASYQFKMALMWRILLITTIVFFIPSCLLGMISPAIVRLSIKNLKEAGNVVGKIYAVSTVGSIVGTFTAGFFLISWAGTRNIILMLGAVLILTAAFSGYLFKTKKPAIAFLLFPSLLLWGVYDAAFKPSIRDDVYFYKESDYFTIKLVEMTGSDESTKLNAMILDNLLHSYVNLEDPLYLEYKYEKMYAEVLRWRYKKDAGFRTLTIGGGGYTFPRYMEVFYPNADIDVVEIDPEVTKTAYTYLGLPKKTKIQTYNMDGRLFVKNCRSSYDVIFIDVFNDLSLPYHLTTKEFGFQMKKILNDDGMVISNIVDDFTKGLFLPSYIKTLREVFGDKNVYLLAVSPNFKDIGISTFIILAVNGNFKIGDFDSFLKDGKNKRVANAVSSMVPIDLMNKVIDGRHHVLLSDDYAPVDNLLAPVFEERFGYNKK